MTQETRPLDSDHPIGMFEWSAFGAWYPDTSCDNGICTDHDGSWTFQGIPCPFCCPAAFWEYQWGGGYVIPTCGNCLAHLPSGTVIKFHDGQSLTWTAQCPGCRSSQPILMREYEAEDGYPEWKPQ